MLTKRRYWKDELWSRIWGGGSENANSFINEHSSALAGAQVASQFCGSQTKILKEGTDAENRIVEVLLAGVSTRFGLRTIKKSIESISSFVPSSEIFVWEHKFTANSSKVPTSCRDDR